MMTYVLTFAAIEHLTGFRCGIFDVTCPECGPGRHEPRNRTREVLRIWREQPDFASFKCARCGIHGWARGNATWSPSCRPPEKRGAARRKAAT
jgi:hypothetical protein